MRSAEQENKIVKGESAFFGKQKTSWRYSKTAITKRDP